MQNSLYHPFKTLQFDAKHCFLSGQALVSSEEEIGVFAPWFLQAFGLADRPFKLLDESIATYQALKVPCSSAVYEEAITPLEAEIQEAFSKGYEGLKEVSEIKLFQWIAKLLYGIIYHEIKQGIRQQRALGEPFTLSQAMAHKFENLHLMLQSLVQPISFEEPKPWSIKVFKLVQEDDFFSYRDELNTLSFSLRAHNFGIIACLQDNGTNAHYHHEVLKMCNGQTLSPAQFEELCARFFYSAYLFNRLPEYAVLPTPDTIFIEAMPLQGISSKPIFDVWDVKTYGQVLENFWKPWGFTLFEIIKDPEKPMSFLTDETGAFQKQPLH
jgi:hypothetical protein